MISQKNMSQIIVGKDLAPLAETETRVDLANGQIGVFKNGSSTAIDGTTDLTAGDVFKIVFKNVDGNIIESAVINYDLIKKKNATLYAVSTDQKTYIGYNGVTGSITVANSDDYYIHLFRKDFSTTYGEHDLYKLVAAYKSDATALQNEIADALVVNAEKNLAIEKTRSGVQVTSVSRINSEAVTATDDFVNNVDVVKGSKYLFGDAKIELTGSSGTANITIIGGLTKLVTFAVGGTTDLTQTATDFVASHAAAYLAVGITVTASTVFLIFTATIPFADPVITNATGNQGGTVFTSFEYATNTSLAVNDYVRLGATTTTATTLTSNIYKVLAISGNVVTLDIPVLETSGEYAAGSGYTEAITNADAIAEDWGLVIASEPAKFVPGLFSYQKITFEVTLSEAFGSTLVTESVTPFKGNGTYEEVAGMEWFLNGNRGDNFRVATYPVAGRSLNAISTKTYDAIVLEYRNDSSTSIDSDVLSFASLIIYTENESSSTIHTDLKDILNIS